MRGVYGTFAAMGLFAAFRYGVQPLRELGLAGVLLGATASGYQSVVRRQAGVRGQNALAEARSERVAQMTGIDVQAKAKGEGPEFDPRLDLIAPVLGFIGLIGAGISAGDPAWLQIARMMAGAVFLGAVSDAMLLGHWYLVQPGLSREPLNELVRWTAISWLPEVALLLVPVGMVSVWTGTIDDGYNGMLGWFWGACVVATIVLVGVTVAALKEKEYSAVMAATGLLYLAILTAFGTDLVARALLAFQ